MKKWLILIFMILIFMLTSASAWIINVDCYSEKWDPCMKTAHDEVKRCEWRFKEGDDRLFECLGRNAMRLEECKESALQECIDATG